MRTLGARPALVDSRDSASDSDPPSDSAYSRVSLHTLRHTALADTDAGLDPDGSLEAETDAETDALSDVAAGVTRRGFSERLGGPRGLPPWRAARRSGRIARVRQRVLLWLEGPPPSDTDDPLDPAYKPLTTAERQQVLLTVATRLALIFGVCLVGLAITLYVGLPHLDPADKAGFRVPRSFDELKTLNMLLKKYKDQYNARLLLCWVTVYLFLQAFAVPGSMYMSMICGAVWGTKVAWPLVVCSIACGASLAYLVSKPMGAVLSVLPNWKRRVDSWKVRINEQPNLISYLVVVRMAPVPPHFVINLMAPHLGISLPTFWISTAFGIAAVSFIHVTIGQKLDEMVSPDEFHLFSLHNTLILGGVILAALFPVAVRKFSKAPPLEEAPGPEGEIALPGDDDQLPARSLGRRTIKVLDVEDVSDDELPGFGTRSWRSPGRPLPAPSASTGLPALPHEADADIEFNPFDSDDESDQSDARELDADPSVWAGTHPSQPP